MLEGDTFQVSADGISRTLYKLRNHGAHGKGISNKRLMVEELYDIKRAKKTYVLREEHDAGIRAHSAQYLYTPNETGAGAGTVNLGSKYCSIDLQELDSSNVESLGTGVLTWETSIASSLYFASNPTLLSGHVLELGSGCGLGGILTQTACRASLQDFGLDHQRLRWIDTFAFTDCSPEILDQCRRNVAIVSHGMMGHVSCHTQLLDWYNVASGCHKYQQYDVVLASDCAYRYLDIEPLSQTIATLVGKAEGRLHFFGPLNRGALHELIRMLREKHRMVVDVECLEMERYRLLPARQKNERVADCASSSVAKFLHVMARHQSRPSSRNDDSSDLSPLD